MLSSSDAPDGLQVHLPRVSIIIPTYNGSARIGKCLGALQAQALVRAAEILVVDDGSVDNTVEVAQSYECVRVLSQANRGPASARNHGAAAAAGDIILFTDDDCEPAADWLERMLAPFSDPEVVGVKGAYRTRQSSLVARFVQAEYEDKYRVMLRFRRIDFIDTYSAGFRKERFLEMQGYDTAFPVACAEDVELSYRMSAMGWKMVFAPQAIVYHRHPNTVVQYLRKKYKFAFWRMLAVRKNPEKAARDSHTPQLMKLQLLLAPALGCSAVFDLATRRGFPVTLVVIGIFIASAVPFSVRAAKAGIGLAVAAPGLLAGRAISQFLGVGFGILNARKAVRRA